MSPRPVTSNMRLADAKDTPQLIGLIKEYCEEEGLDFNLPFVEDFISRNLEMTTVLVSVDDEDKLTGVLSFNLRPHHFTGEATGFKVTWFMSKKHRGRVGLELLKKSEEICEAFGVKEYLLALPSHTRPPKGYKVKEIIYSKELK